MWRGVCGAEAPAPDEAPIPDIRQLMADVMEHQREMDSVRENYTYHSQCGRRSWIQAGRCNEDSTEDADMFFVNSHRIERTVKQAGKPLEGHDLEKETSA